MAEFKFTKKAIEDLSKIWEYTLDRWSEKQADKYYLMILDNCRLIANDPGIGKKYEGISEGLYGLNVNRHIIFYRKLLNNPVEITRILHERMDLKTRIKE